MTASIKRSTVIRTALSVAWTVVLIILAIGSTTNLFLLTDFVQPYCSATPDEFVPLCQPCGLHWGMFGVLEPTQCPNSFMDELLDIFVATPRMVLIIFGMAWFVTVPLLIFNFVHLFRRWAHDQETALERVQLIALGYVLLWAGGAAALFTMH